MQKVISLMLEVEEEASHLKASAQKEADNYLNKVISIIKNTEKEIDSIVKKEIEKLNFDFLKKAENKKQKYILEREKHISLSQEEIKDLAQLAVSKIIK